MARPRPAQERLDADHRVVGQPHDGLEVETELVRGDGAP